MMYRVNMIYSITRNSAIPEVGGKDPIPKPLFPQFPGILHFQRWEGIEHVQSQYDLLDFQEFCISRGGGEGPNAEVLIYRFPGIL